MSSKVKKRVTTRPERLTISFWIWGFMCGCSGNVYSDLDQRMVELKERGFNCIRIDSGAGFCHDLSGHRLGEVEIMDPFPGHSQYIRQMSVLTGGGRFDVLEAVLAIFAAAKRHGIYVILSSWYYLHSYWVADSERNQLWLGLREEERYLAFAKLLGYILDEIKARDCASQLAFAEIFNEADGLAPLGYNCQDVAVLNQFRRYHEEALAFLRRTHPDVLFALDTCTPYVRQEFFPGNIQVWNAHSYYIWPRSYAQLEQDLLSGKLMDPEGSESFAKIRRYCSPAAPTLAEVRASRAGQAPAGENWTRRVWLYRQLRDEGLPELEAMLSQQLAADIAVYKERIDQWSRCFSEHREQHLGADIPLVMGEAASYCASNSMRWEERSDSYWEIIEYAVRALKKLGFWGCMPRTTSGPEDPCWTECPERLRRVNKLFLAR